MTVPTIDTTIGGASSNSYINLSDADLYFFGRFNSSSWTDATDDNKTIALIQACRDIDNLRFIGCKFYTGRVGASNYQRLEFPRGYPIESYGADDILQEYIETIEHNITFPRSTDSNGDPYIPELVKNAQCEQAIFILAIDDEVERRQRLQEQGVLTFKLGVFSETYRKGGVYTNICPTALRFLNEFIDRDIRFIRE